MKSSRELLKSAALSPALISTPAFCCSVCRIHVWSILSCQLLVTFLYLNDIAGRKVRIKGKHLIKMNDIIYEYILQSLSNLLKRFRQKGG